MANRNYFILDTYRSIKNKLPDYVLGSIKKLLPIYLLSSFFEIFGLIILFPVIKVIIEPAYIEQNSYMQFLYHKLNFTSNLSFVLFLFTMITLVFVTKNLIIYLISKKQASIAFNLSSRLSHEKYNTYANKNYDFHSENNTAILLRNFTQVPFDLISYSIIPFISLISELFVLALIVAAITFYDPLLFWSIILFTAPFLFLYNRVYKRKLRSISSKRDEETAAMYKLGIQSMETFREMIIFNKKDYFRPLYKKAVDSYTKSMSEVYLMNSFSPKIVETVAVLGIFSIFLGGYLLNKDIQMLAQFLIIFTIAAYRVIPSMNKIILCTNYIKSSYYLFQYFDKTEDKQPPETSVEDIEKIKPMAFHQRLELKALSFAYKNKSEPVLDNIELTINKGEAVGIIGSSGSGKTTLLNILLRLYTEDSGGIYVDGVKVDRDNLVAWYKLVSYVPQDIILLDGSIVENIAFGIAPEKIDQVLLQSVIEQAQLGDFVKNLPQGIHTPIGEKGVKISGGQRQRIGIARALYHGGKILILDEATSALDSETEHSISESIKQLSDSLTIILIAHRLNTLRHCNRIYKMENNKLQETVLQF